MGPLRRRGSGPAVRKRLNSATHVEPEASVILAALADPVIVLDRSGHIRFVNPAAEQFLGAGAAALCGSMVTELLAPHSPLLSLIDSVWKVGNTVAEHDLLLEGPRFGNRSVTIQAALTGEGADLLVLSLHERSMAEMMDRHLTHRSAARSITAMAAMLAHEVKNPLSGIRGAAQLPIERETVNIHEVLERVRKAAQSGFARHVRLIEEYDPSLPPVRGNRDLLVQVFLNLVKNAAEALPNADGEIILTTAYRHGLRVTGPGGEGRQHLPLMVAVTDNGAGIPEDLRPHLFEPFVTTKRNGTGLGLALVAKVISDHGGVIEFDSQPRRTVFRVFLPVVAQDGSG
jgi:two-component system, NtrC family, nitrogen regulation sensor histidine kinase GlnL